MAFFMTGSAWQPNCKICPAIFGIGGDGAAMKADIFEAERQAETALTVVAFVKSFKNVRAFIAAQWRSIVGEGEDKGLFILAGRKTDFLCSIAQAVAEDIAENRVEKRFVAVQV